MKIIQKGLLQFAAVLTMAVLAPVRAAYPERPVTLVAPFPAGGSADVVSRLLARKLEEQLGKTVVVENRPGAGSVVGGAYVANAKPDGYTLLLGSNSTFTLNPALLPRMPYDAATAFEPIGQVGTVTLALIVNPSVPAQTVPKLVAEIKAHPDQYAYGSYGNGTTSNFAGAMFNDVTGLNLLHVPYRGSSPAMADLIGGQIPIAFDTIVAALPQVRNGKIRALAVTSVKRSPFMPDVPSLDELGYKGYEMTSYLTIVAPAGLPSEVRKRLNEAMTKLMADPDMQEKMKTAGFEANWKTIPDWAGSVRAEIAAMKDIAQKSNIRAE